MLSTRSACLQHTCRWCSITRIYLVTPTLDTPKIECCNGLLRGEWLDRPENVGYHINMEY